MVGHRRINMTNSTGLSKIQEALKNPLPDNQIWTNRLEIKSESSNRLYIIAQNKTKRHWACSCPGYRTRRKCKHLAALGLPAFEQPHEIDRIK